MSRFAQSKDRKLGAILGGAVGDALGITQEIFPRSNDVERMHQQVLLQRRERAPPQTDYEGGGPWQHRGFVVNPGEWSDDTSMMLCLADSLAACATVDVKDLMERFRAWWRTGYNASRPMAFGLGGNIMKAMQAYDETDPYRLQGGTNPETDAGNGSLMRLAPVPVYWAGDLGTALAMARLQTATTHNIPEALDGSALMAFMIWHGINGASKRELFERLPACPQIEHEGVRALTRVESWSCKTRDEIRTLPGRCLWSLEAAMWCVYQSESFEGAVILAVNMGGDADTVACITGQIAGALYGLKAIPARWLEGLAKKEHVMKCAEAVCRLY